MINFIKVLLRYTDILETVGLPTYTLLSVPDPDDLRFLFLDARFSNLFPKTRLQGNTQESICREVRKGAISGNR